MVGKKLKEIGFTKELRPNFTSVKEAVVPFVRFPGIDVVLSPEMKSTGEVMGMDFSPGLAYFKSQLAAGSVLPQRGGSVFLSLRDVDKIPAIPLARELIALGFSIYATKGTATVLYNAGVKVKAMFSISKGRPNVIDGINEKEINWVVNTPTTGPQPKGDEIQMRAHSITRGVPITTTINGLHAAIEGLKALKDMERMEICSIQEYHRLAPALNV
jgi:carbamoyl-phosphate synthase large subunit